MKNVFLKKFLLFLLFLFFTKISAANLVMIDPAGDLNNPGRKIGDSCERGITFQMAEKLKNLLSEMYGVKAVLTREPREVVYPLQNASYSNRFGADFFLSLHVFKQENPKSKVFIYHQMYNPIKDLAGVVFNPLEFISVYEAHFRDIRLTISLTEKMRYVLSSSKFIKIIDFGGSVGLPLKPLVGVMAPAIVLEVGLYDENDWKNLLQPIAECLSFLKES